MTLWRRILMERRRLSSRLPADMNFSGGIASISSKSNHSFGRGLEKHVEKLEEQTGDFNQVLVTRTIKLRVPCKDRNKYQYGLWKLPRAEPIYGIQNMSNFSYQQRRYFQDFLKQDGHASFEAFFTWALTRKEKYPFSCHKFRQQFYFHGYLPKQKEGWMDGWENYEEEKYPVKFGEFRKNFYLVLRKIGILPNGVLSIWGNLGNPDSMDACIKLTKHEWTDHAREKGIVITYERYLALGCTFAKGWLEELWKEMAKLGIVVGDCYQSSLFTDAVSLANQALKTSSKRVNWYVYPTFCCRYPRNGCVDIDAIKVTVSRGRELNGIILYT